MARPQAPNSSIPSTLTVATPENCSPSATSDTPLTLDAMLGGASSTPSAAPPQNDADAAQVAAPPPEPLSAPAALSSTPLLGGAPAEHAALVTADGVPGATRKEISSCGGAAALPIPPPARAAPHAAEGETPRGATSNASEVAQGAEGFVLTDAHAVAICAAVI